MNKLWMRGVLLGMVMAGLLQPGNAWAESQDTLRRFALVVGSNSGGNERVLLRYAESDARIFSALLQKIGGIFPMDNRLLIEPDRKAFMDSLLELQAMILEARKQAKKVEFILYYSGHSDEEALLLGGNRLYYTEMKNAIEQMPADVRIAILDSCSSGAFTRLKGGKARAPFLVDSSNDMSGYAVITSSSSDEASQESDRLRGSFFTHALVSGMRGAADMSQDGRVTLNEAYQFAYNETLARTEKTMSGPQHPNYNIQMTGTGDVVMTDIRNSSALLGLESTLAGRLFIRNAQNQLVVELRKHPDRPIQLGLEEGDYTITREFENRLYMAKVRLQMGQQTALGESQFTETTREATLARGESSAEELAALDELPPVNVKMPAEGYRRQAWDFQVLPLTSDEKVIDERLVHLFGASIDYLDGWSIGAGLGMVQESTKGFQIAGLGNTTEKDLDGLQIAGVFNFIGGSMDGVQVSGCLNYIQSNQEGVQVAEFLNITEGRLDGVQVSGVFNTVGQNAEGVQSAGVFNFAGKNMDGAQVSGVFNHAGAEDEGIQVAGVYNYAEAGHQGAGVAGVFNYAGQNQDGVQVAGVFNYNGGAGQGVQAAGVLNYTGAGREGAQVAGVCNIAGQGPKLTQIGVVNITGDCEQAQIGLVNIARQQRGTAIGLVSLADNGKISLPMWWDNLTGMNLGAKFLVNHFYSIIGLGKIQWFTGDDEPFSCHMHFGGHFDLGMFYVETDFGFVAMREPGRDLPYFFRRQALQARAMVGCELNDFLAVFGGAGANYLHDELTRETRFKDGHFTPLYLGGLQITF